MRGYYQSQMSSSTYGTNNPMALIGQKTETRLVKPGGIGPNESIFASAEDRSRTLYGFTPRVDTSGPFDRQPRPFVLTQDIADGMVTTVQRVFDGMLRESDMWIFDLMPIEVVSALASQFVTRVIRYNKAILDATPALGISREVSQSKESYTSRMERYGIRFTLEHDVMHSAAGEQEYLANMFQLAQSTQSFLAECIVYAMMDCHRDLDTAGPDAVWNLSYNMPMDKKTMFSMLDHARATWGAFGRTEGFPAVVLTGKKILSNRQEEATHLIIPANSGTLLKYRALSKNASVAYRTKPNDVLQGDQPVGDMDGGLIVKEMWKLPDEYPGRAHDPLVRERRYAEYYVLDLSDGQDLKTKSIGILDHEADAIVDLSASDILAAVLARVAEVGMTVKTASSDSTAAINAEDIEQVILFRTQITYAMGSAIMVAAKEPIGRSYTSSENLLAGTDVNTKTTAFNLTVSCAQHITRPKAVYILHNVYADAYVSGGGTDLGTDFKFAIKLRHDARVDARAALARYAAKKADRDADDEAVQAELARIRAATSKVPNNRWMPLDRVPESIAAEAMGLPDGFYAIDELRPLATAAVPQDAFASFTDFDNRMNDGPLFAGRGCTFFPGKDSEGKDVSRGCVRTPNTMWGTSVEYDGVVADRCGRGINGRQLTDNEQVHLKATRC